MAELGVAASIAGLISLAIQVTQSAYDYVSSVKGSAKTILDFASEISLLTSVLGGMREAFESCSDAGDVALAGNLSDHLEELFNNLQLLARKLDRRSRTTGMGRLRVLTWPFHEKETRQIIERFQRFRGIFGSALASNNLIITNAIHSDVQKLKWKASLQQILANAALEKAEQIQECLQGMHRGQLVQDVLNWLSPSLPSKQKDASAMHVPGTGVWFLGEPYFKKWLEFDVNETGQRLVLPL
jgi:hypothetical protein